MTVCWENLYHAQEFQKRAHNKSTKPKSYAPDNNVWLNSKHLKTKRNRKLETKFFGLLQVLHPMKKQAYKLELPKKWKIHDVFHVSLLEQDTTKKEWVNKTTQAEFETGDDEEYKVEGIWNSVVYAMESEAGHLPRLYYLVYWKSYPEEESTWEPTSAMHHLQKLLSKFHRENPTKPTATSLPVDSALPITRPTVKPTGTIKQNWGRPTKNGTNKRPKKTWVFLKISWFYSPISHQGWEVFYRLIKLVFLLSFSTRFGRFFINLES